MLMEHFNREHLSKTKETHCGQIDPLPFQKELREAQPDSSAACSGKTGCFATEACNVAPSFLG
jgi:hypothetical protein